MSTLVALIAFGTLAWALYDWGAERRIREAETGKGSPGTWADQERSLRDERKDKGPTES